MRERALRFAVVGTGNMAATMIAAMRQSRDIEFVGISSRTPARATEACARFGLSRAFSGIEEIAADASIDAVYIATDPKEHAATSISALRAGKAVLCEKPCSLTAQEMEAIIAAADAGGSLFMEAIATPFLPAVSHALDLARGGTLGQARHLAASFGYPITTSSHPLCFTREGGVLRDRMVYLVTLGRLALGPVTAIFARIRRDRDGIDVHADLMLAHEGDGTSQLTASFDTLLANDAAIGCERGKVRLQAPLLACETIRIEHVAAPTERAVPAGGLGQRLRQKPVLRRLAGSARDHRARRFITYGRSPYAAELEHFRHLVRSQATGSSVLPPSLSLEVHRVLAEARAQGGAF